MRMRYRSCRDLLILTAVAMVTATTAQVAAAQSSWPSRPVRIVIPFAAGGGNDVIVRPLAERLQAKFKQSFIVENRSGAGGINGTQVVTRSDPDGYTFMVTTASVVSLAPIYKIDLDVTKDLTPITMLAKTPTAIVVPANSPFNSIDELVSYDKAHPGELLFASSGTGSSGHLASELFNMKAGTKLKHVPYKGAAPALTDVVGGRVNVFFTTIVSAAEMVRSGRVKLLAYGSEERPADAPKAPTVKASSKVDYESGLWYGLFAPQGLPIEITNAMNQAVTEILRDPAFSKYLANEGAVPMPMSSGQFAAIVKEEAARVRDIVETARITSE